MALMPAGSDHWFAPKRYGYGATPVTWQGWVVTCVFVGVIAGFSLYVFRDGPTPSPGTWLAWVGGVVVLLAGFIRLCRAKTNGTWRWRWGANAE